MKFYLFILSCLLVLCQCSLFSPMPYIDQTIYELSVPCARTPETKTKKSIYLAPMEVYPGIASSDMKYLIKPYQANYFSKNDWVSPPATQLHYLLMTDLQRMFSYVSDTRIENVDVILKTTLIKFEQVFDPRSKKSYFQVCLFAEVINPKIQRVIQSKTFEITETAPTADPYGGVLAANKAVEQLLNGIERLLE